MGWGAHVWISALVRRGTTDSDYSHEIRRCLLLGRKAMTDLAY